MDCDQRALAESLIASVLSQRLPDTISPGIRASAPRGVEKTEIVRSSRRSATTRSRLFRSCVLRVFSREHGIGAGPPSASDRRLVQLNEIPTGVRADGDGDRTLTIRYLGEHDAELAEATVFVFEVVDLERRCRNALLEQRLLERPAGGIGIRLQRQFEVSWPVRGDDGNPAVLANRNVVLLHEAEHLRVERQRLVLIVDHDARQLDSHGPSLTEAGGWRFSKVANAAPIKPRHPGNRAAGGIPGTTIIERARRLYIEGGMPTRCLKR